MSRFNPRFVHPPVHLGRRLLIIEFPRGTVPRSMAGSASVRPGGPPRNRRRPLDGAGRDDGVEAGQARKRQCFEDGDTMWELAQPYRITTAKVPLQALTTIWSLATNRPLDQQHVQRLCTIFHRGGLSRSTPSHRLLVMSTEAEVSRMEESLGLDASKRRGGAEDAPYFADWLSINEGNMMEVLAGQHRIKALEAYVRQTGAGDDELWWTCEVYNRGEFGPSALVTVRLLPRWTTYGYLTYRYPAAGPEYQAPHQPAGALHGRRPWPDMDTARSRIFQG